VFGDRTSDRVRLTYSPFASKLQAIAGQRRSCFGIAAMSLEQGLIGGGTAVLGCCTGVVSPDLWCHSRKYVLGMDFRRLTEVPSMREVRLS